jgi:hypothetical protein
MGMSGSASFQERKEVLVALFAVVQWLQGLVASALDVDSAYQTRQRISFTIGWPALQLNACWNSGMLTTNPFTRYLGGNADR